MLLRRTVFIAATALLCAALHAQTNTSAPHPASSDRATEIVVPWPPGGGTDSVARAFAEAATAALGTAPVVVNRPGASGSIGFHYASTPPAGGKVALISAEILLLPLQNIGQVSLDQFIPVAQLTNDPLAVTVHADAPWNDIKELIAYAQQPQARVTVSTAGVGTTHHMGVAALGQATRGQYVPVPYQGTIPAVTGVLTGEVQATIAAYAELAHYVQSGKLKTLAVLAPERLPHAPDIPTMKELGYDLEYSVWRGIALAKGTPAEQVQQWQRIANQVATSSRFGQALSGLSITPAFIDTESFTQRLQQEETQYRKLLPVLQLETQ